jgi:cytoskeletal protein RodZ
MNETADHMGDLKRKVQNFIKGVGRGTARVPPADAVAQEQRRLPEIGSVLRAARVHAGLELRDVAAMLKIRHVFMLAIEDGRYHELPGTAYAVGFVRAYADYLGLDCEAVVRRFKDEVASKVSQPNLYFPTPVPEGRVPGGTILLFSVVLACLVYGGWYVLSATDRSMADMIPALPQRLVSLLGDFHGESGAGAGTVATAPSGTIPAPPVAGTPPATPAAIATTTGPEPAPTPSATVPFKAATPTDSRPGPAMAGASEEEQGSPMPDSAPTPATTTPPAAAGDTGSDSGDEIPLVSGPADETVGEPGPLVPMAPRTKPTPPGATPVVPPVVVADATAGNGVADAGAPPAAATAAAGVATPAPSPAADAGLPTGRIYGGQNRDSHIQIRATQDAWVQIRDTNGDPVFTRVMHPGDVFKVPDHPGMRLRTGNAGGLVMIVDGGPAHPLGQVGQVLRDVPIDAGQAPPGDTTGD